MMTLTHHVVEVKQRKALLLNAILLSNIKEKDENKSAIDVMGNKQLLVIAHEVMVIVKNSLSVDWRHSESARARIRVKVRRVLRRLGYLPDLEDAAIQTVLQQAEIQAAAWI